MKTPVSQVDLYPTLAELAGVKAPTNLQGESLVPLLKDPGAKSRGWALTQVVRGGGGGDGEGGGKKKAAQPESGERVGRKAAAAGPGVPDGRILGYSLRTLRWRYTEWGDGGKHGRELYDHDQDPKELKNLAHLPAHAASVRELANQLSAAVKASFPPSGQIPEAREGHWAPVIR